MQPDALLALTRGWLDKAQEDLAAAERLIESPPLYGVAVYHCQQTAEKVLKGFLVWNNKPFALTHDLRDLLAQSMAVDGTFATRIGTAETLFPYATQFRYPSAVPVPSAGDATTAVDLARDLFAFVVGKLPPDARP